MKIVDMNFKVFKKGNFLNLSAKDSSFAFAKFVVVPCGLEATVSYSGGTAHGPQAILKASAQVELFDEELWNSPYKKGIATLPPLVWENGVKGALSELEKTIVSLIQAQKIPLILGGEHTLTLGNIQAMSKKYERFSILHFDAHSDLRDSLEGNRFSHACVMRRCLEISQVSSLVQIGIRNVSNEASDGYEADFIKKNSKRIKIFWGRDRKNWDIKKMLSGLAGDVFISFDVDGFDSSAMPATGTPEPGGFFWEDVLPILKAVAKERHVIGADFVELAPIPNLPAYDFLVAKLIYKLIGYIL